MASGEINNGTLKSRPTGWTASFKIKLEGLEGRGDFVADLVTSLDSYTSADLTATYNDASKLTGVPISSYSGTIGGGEGGCDAG